MRIVFQQTILMKYHALFVIFKKCHIKYLQYMLGAQWLSGRVLDLRPRGRWLEPHRRHCIVSLSKNINPSIVLVHPRKTRPCLTVRLLMGRKESNQTKTKHLYAISNTFNICLERSGSVVECLTGDQGAAGSSLTDVTALCP